MFSLECTYAILYLIASLIYIIGSVLFYPQYSQLMDFGLYCYMFGALIFAVLSIKGISRTFFFENILKIFF